MKRFLTSFSARVGYFFSILKSYFPTALAVGLVYLAVILPTISDEFWTALLISAVLLGCGCVLFLNLWKQRRDRPVGPLFELELSRLVQRGRTSQVRFVYLFLAVGLLFWLHPRGQTGKPVISVMATLFFNWQMIWVFVLTPAYLASAFTEDKERKIVSQILITDLTDRELVLGKLLSRMALIGLMLIVGLPFICLYVANGVIEGSAAIIAVIATVVCLVSSGSLSLLFSVLCRTTRHAMIWSYGVLLFVNLYCWQLPAVSPFLVIQHSESKLDQAIGLWAHDWHIWQQTFLNDPGRNIPSVREAYFQTRPPYPEVTRIRYLAFAPFLLVQGTIFLFCTVYSIRSLRASCLGDEESLVGVSWTGERIQPAFQESSTDHSEPVSPARWPHPRPPVGENALLWKEAEFGDAIFPISAMGKFGRWVRSRTALFVWPTAILVCAWLRWYLGLNEWLFVFEMMNLLITVVTCLLLGGWCLALAIRMASTITREREQETLVDLLLLPVHTRELLHAKWLGGILRAGGIGYWLLLIWLVGLASGFLHPVSFLCLIFAAATFLASIASIGLWISVVNRSTVLANLSMAVAMLICVGIPTARSIMPEPRNLAIQWMDQLFQTQMHPAYAIPAVTFSSTDFDLADLGWLFSGPSQEALNDLVQFKHWQRFKLLRAAIVQLIWFGAAACCFLYLARWRFKKEFK